MYSEKLYYGYYPGRVADQMAKYSMNGNGYTATGNTYVNLQQSPSHYNTAQTYVDARTGQGYSVQGQTSPVAQNTNASNSTTSQGVAFPVHKLSAAPLPVDKYNGLVALYNKIQAKKYATSAINPVRNYLTVYEYSVHDQWVIWDYETGYVHLTGLWKAAEHATATAAKEDTSHPHRTKADIVKLLDSTPKEYHSYIKRIRGGVLKIQGTWLPYQLCKILARRFCYYIRFELIPIFGNDFPDYCLTPDNKKFGDLRFEGELHPAPMQLSLPQQQQQQGQQQNQQVLQQQSQILQPQTAQVLQQSSRPQVLQSGQVLQLLQPAQSSLLQYQQPVAQQYPQVPQTPRSSNGYRYQHRHSQSYDSYSPLNKREQGSGPRTPPTLSPLRTPATVSTSAFDVTEASHCLQQLSNASQTSPKSEAKVTSYFDLPKSSSEYRLGGSWGSSTTSASASTASESSDSSGANATTSAANGTKRTHDVLRSPVSFSYSNKRSKSIDKPAGMAKHGPSSSVSSLPPINSSFQTPASQMVYTPHTPNYIISGSERSSQVKQDGISSLLLAADMTENPPAKARRISIKINDLLS